MSDALDDDLTEHHRMRTIEDLRKEFLEIEALRKELAEAYRLRDFHHNDAINSRLELEAANASLAETKAALEVYDRTFPKKSELELHAALEAANVREKDITARWHEEREHTSNVEGEAATLRASIVDLQGALEAANARTTDWKAATGSTAGPCICYPGRYCRPEYPCPHTKLAEYQMQLDARAERAEARVTELAAQNKHMYGVLLDAEDLLGVEETGELITRPIGRLIARAERAETRIAELEQLIYSAQNELGRLSDSRALLSASLDEECARAERAEAEADSLRATIDNMRAMNIKLTFEATGKVLAAEAECKAMREASHRIGFWLSAALEDPGVCDAMKADIHAWFAALNPSPAEREE